MAFFKFKSDRSDPQILVRREWEGPTILLDSQGKQFMSVADTEHATLCLGRGINTPQEAHEVGEKIRAAAREWYEAEDHLVEVLLPEGEVRRTMFACPRAVRPVVRLKPEDPDKLPVKW